MVSDAVLAERLREVLRSSDLATTTTATVRRKLEEDFGVDLSERKAFIREQVDVFIQSEFDAVKKEEEDPDGEGDDAEEEDGEAGSEGEEEDNDDEEGGSNGRRSTNKRSVKNKEVKKRGGGFTKLCTLSPQLQKLVSVSELARTEVVKKLWAYIRENNLQDPNNKKKIICDETLKGLFNVNSIDMFQMNKALSRHIWPLNSDEAGPVSSTSKEKQPKRKREGTDKSSTKEKKGKSSASGFLAPLPMSDALVSFIGTGENALPRAHVVKKIWEYIKENNLQDPSDKRNILCDEKLKELFNVESFHGFTVSKLLAPHFIKTGRHTQGHISYYVTGKDEEDPAVFTGDTLFVAGCGKFFEGSAEQMYESLCVKLGSLPKPTRVFCGHEYTAKNLQFASTIEPENAKISQKLLWAQQQRNSGLPTVPSTIGEELETNPFMRVDLPEIQAKVDASTPVGAIAEMRRLKDNWRG